MRKRNHVIPIRLNTKEMKHLETQVAVSGLNREEYLRTLILGAEVRAKPCTHHDSEVCTAGNPDTADLAGWHLSVRQAVFKIVPFYGYQLFHCKQRG